jgi:hypothetical protein
MKSSPSCLLPQDYPVGRQEKCDEILWAPLGMGWRLVAESVLSRDFLEENTQYLIISIYDM